MKLKSSLFSILLLIAMSHLVSANFFSELTAPKTFPTGNDNTGGVSAPAGKYLNTPVVPATCVNPYTANATRTVTDLTIPSIGEIPLNFSRFNNTRPSSAAAWFGTDGNWRHSYQWDFSYNAGVVFVTRVAGQPDQLTPGGIGTNGGIGSITVGYPDGTINTFFETNIYTGIFVSKNPEVTDYIVIDQAANITKLAQHYNDYTNFRLINSSNQACGFSRPGAMTTYTPYRINSITDSKGQYTGIYYDGSPSSFAPTKIVEPGGRYINVHYVGYTYTPNGIGAQPVTRYYIDYVESSDSLATHYNYHHNLGSDGVMYQNLYSVDYPDSTSASYNYQSYGTSGLSNLYQARDSHATGIHNIQYNYWGAVAGYGAPPIGAVQKVIEINTGTVVTEIGLVNSGGSADPTQPLVKFTDITGYGYSLNYGTGGILNSTVNINDDANAQSYNSVAHNYTYSQANSNTIYVPETQSDGTTLTNTNARLHNIASTKSVLGHIYQRTWPIVPPETVAPTEKWTYNSSGYLLTYKDPNNYVTQITRYPVTNLVQTILYPDGNSESFTYGAFNQVATHTRRNGGIEKYTYYSNVNADGSPNATDAPFNGMLKSVEDGEGGVKSYTYDAHYHIKTLTNENLHTTDYECDYNGRVLTITNPATTLLPTRTTVKYSYDNWGNILTYKNELSKIWAYSYDDFNRLLNTTDPLGHSITRAYDPNTPTNRLPLTITNDLTGKVVGYTYVINWGYKVWTATKGYGTTLASKITYTYDEDGNLSTVADQLTPQNVYHLYYDERDRVSSAVDPVGNTSSFLYDDASNLSSESTPDGTSYYYYDKMNRLKQKIDPTGATSDMTYDTEGSLYTYREPNQDPTSGSFPSSYYKYTYDHCERLKTMQYPGGATENYTYYDDGSMHTYQTKSGETRTYTYDERECLTFVSFGATTADELLPANYRIIYDSAARATKVYSSVSTINYTYYDDNTVETDTQNSAMGSQAYTFKYTYNNDGLTDTLTYPDSTVLHYKYNDRNDLTDIFQGTSTAFTVHYDYDLAGNRTGRNLGNGTKSVLGYDAVQRLTSIVDTTPSPVANTSLQKFYYGYDGMSRKKYLKKSTGLGDVYSYDAGGQLKTVKYDATHPDTVPINPLRSVTYDYDDSGNRLKITDQLSTESSAFVVNYTPTAKNQYSQVGNASIGYSANGNLSSFQETGGSSTRSLTCKYDVDNRFRQAFNNFDNTAVSQNYDPLGRCAYRSENGVTTCFYYDIDGNVLLETDSDITLKRYVNGVGSDEKVNFTDRLNHVYFYHSDGLGNTTKITDSSGATIETYTYDVYGNPVIKNAQGSFIWKSSINNTYLFTGREYIYALGVYDYRSRIYDPYLGRFWQPDSIGHAGDSYNLYRYCQNDPVNHIDPDGTTEYFGWQSGGPILYSNNVGYVWNPFTQEGTFSYSGGSSSGSAGVAGIAALSGSPLMSKLYASQIEAAHVSMAKAEFTKNSSFGGISLLSAAHGLLQTAAFVPGAGSITSLLDAGIYMAQGEYGEAALSALGVIPELGAAAATTIRLGRLAKAAKEVSVAGKASGFCFAEGTKVSTPSGERNIEDIEVGDAVYAYDLTTKRVVISYVIETYCHSTNEWQKIQFSGGDDISVTSGHKFWIPSSQAWVEASHLQLGMTVLKESGEFEKVVNVSRRYLSQPEKTYNFNVANQHDYFVGASQILVHNANSCMAAAEGTTLYRGVAAGTSKYDQALQGVAVPRGTVTDVDSLIKHVLSEDVNAGVTSWTTDPAVAARFAGPNGIILNVPLSKVAGQVVARPFVGGKYASESEVLLQGVVNTRK